MSQRRNQFASLLIKCIARSVLSVRDSTVWFINTPNNLELIELFGICLVGYFNLDYELDYGLCFSKVSLTQACLLFFIFSVVTDNLLVYIVNLTSTWIRIW